jgi:GNAT superfamily N-acetyltransferase
MGTFTDIRAYTPLDKAAIRKICADTGAAGESVERLFHDREIFADLITMYYTDFEPGSVWVVDDGARVVGYVTGCLDNRRYVRVMTTNVLPKVFIRGVLRGVFCKLDTLRYLCALFQTFLMRCVKPGVFLRIYPAHLHVNIAEGFRGQGVGERLIERFLTQLRQEHFVGVQASVSGENHSARTFFEKVGFSVIGQYPARLFQKDKGFYNGYTIIYGKKV